MKKKYAQVMACVLSLALLISGCAGSGSAESTGNTNGTDNALAFVNPTDSTDGTLATDPTGTVATDPTGTGATEATGEAVDPTETSGEATESTSPATSGSSSGSTSGGNTGTGNSGGSNSGSSSSGNSGSGSTGSNSGSEATTPTTEATEPTTEATEATTEPVVVHTHSYKQTVVSPTCTESGYTVYTCSCGYSYVGKVLETMTPALGHDWASTTTVTCTASGVTTYTCTRCGYSYSENVDALGHDWKCTGAVNEGYWLYQLICGCGKVFNTLEEWEAHSDEVYASGDLYTYYADCCHWASYDNWVVTRSGWEYTCTRCGEYWFKE